jgi:hypothetical protein
MKDWHQFPIFLTLESVEMGAIDDITTILLKCMAKYKHLVLPSILNKSCIKLVIPLDLPQN